MRRVLRIFPLYYFVVLVAIVINASYSREYAPWLLTYTLNIKMAAQGWYISNFAHFWSLAVEEQFYMLSPCVILLVPRRWLVPSAVTMIAIGLLFRVTMLIAWQLGLTLSNGLTIYISTPAAFDILGFGSLVAILLAVDKSGERARLLLRRALSSALILLLAGIFGGGNVSMVLVDFAFALFFGWLIWRASIGFGGPAGKLLGSGALVFVGRISYGIYVYHALVPGAAAALAGVAGFELKDGALLKTVFCLTTLVVSTISWYLFERPINDLKRRFSTPSLRDDGHSSRTLKASAVTAFT